MFVILKIILVPILPCGLRDRPTNYLITVTSSRLEKM